MITIPKFVTFTGIDDCTDIDIVNHISEKYPVEWGILVGGKLSKNRYPKNVFNKGKFPNNCSLHVCGSLAQEVLNKNYTNISNIIEPFSRVQINAIKYDYDIILDFYKTFNKPAIIQVRDEFPNEVEGISYLYDKSGGKGKVSTYYPVQPIEYNSLVGYAGGIGPNNVTDVLKEINAHNFWIDMETNIRDENDWLDLEKCLYVCEQIWGK